MFTMAKDINLVRLTFDKNIDIKLPISNPIEIGAKIQDTI